MEIKVEELSIREIHDAFRSGSLTARSLVEHYLRRIQAYDREGPGIRSIVTVNQNALNEADRLDRILSETWMMKGPLHGVPFLIKDQIETKGIVTTFGSTAFRNYVPDRDATIVRKIREAGGIILAKAAMPDFGVSWYGVSSILGDTLNPYDLSRDPGGSSSGVGAGIASSFATVGIGEDTAGSIRVPSSFCGLAGIRVTTGLISRSGMCPIINFQDTPGPMGRSVEDIATVLDVIEGYDPDDPATSISTLFSSGTDHLTSLSHNALSTSRIGILRDAFPGDISDPVRSVMEGAISRMESQGTEFVDPFVIPDLAERIELSSLYGEQSKHDLDGFIRTRKGSPMKSIAAIISSGSYHGLLDILETISESGDIPEDYPDYYRRRFAQVELREEIVRLMTESRLDAILYPAAKILPPLKSEIRERKWPGMSFPVNSLIASHSGCPAVTVPAGFTDQGLPVGMELLGRPFGEQRLLDLAYSYEVIAGLRKFPGTVPPI